MSIDHFVNTAFDNKNKLRRVLVDGLVGYARVPADHPSVIDKEPTMDCSNCRHRGTFKRPRILRETGFGDGMMFDDASNDETVYQCKSTKSEHAGTEIGTTPVECEAWEKEASTSEEARAEMDEWERRFAARASKKQEQR